MTEQQRKPRASVRLMRSAVAYERLACRSDVNARTAAAYRERARRLRERAERLAAR